MLTLLLKRIWNERKSNAWLWIELFIVFIILWFIVDFGYTSFRIYTKPNGYNIDNTYLIRVNVLSPQSEFYIPADEKHTTTGEDLLSLVERLRRHPDIEAVSLSEGSHPYNWNNYGGRLKYDTINMSVFRRTVTPDFFNVFLYENIDRSGSRSLAEALSGNSIVVGADIMPDGTLYGNELKGLTFYYPDDTTTHLRIGAVTKPVKYYDFDPGAWSQFYSNELKETDIAAKDGTDITFLELCIRAREGTSPDFARKLLEDSPRLYITGNCYIMSVQPFSQIRESFLSYNLKEFESYGYIAFFLIVNIFLGIIAAFWFRTQQRCEEMGLRVALGSTPTGLRKMLIYEGVLLLLIILIPALLVCYTIGYSQLTVVSEAEWEASRFLVAACITFFLIIIMIILGILYPARQAMKVKPAEALRDE